LTKRGNSSWFETVRRTVQPLGQTIPTRQFGIFESEP
jgi:hypothetical protein